MPRQAGAAGKRAAKTRKPFPILEGLLPIERFLGPSSYPTSGERVVSGQRLLQAAGDVLLGWAVGPGGRHFYIRQLQDQKGSAVIEAMTHDDLVAWGRLCGWALARGHARSGDPVAIAGYLGDDHALDHALADFAAAYADQTEKDHAALVAAIRSGRTRRQQGSWRPARQAAFTIPETDPILARCAGAEGRPSAARRMFICGATSRIRSSPAPPRADVSLAPVAFGGTLQRSCAIPSRTSRADGSIDRCRSRSLRNAHAPFTASIRPVTNPPRCAQTRRRPQRGTPGDRADPLVPLDRGCGRSW